MSQSDSEVNLYPLELFPLPYTTSEAPRGLFRDVQTLTGHPDATAFDTGLDGRDVFLGRRRCVVCGASPFLQRCHIVRRSDNRAVSPMYN